jgi:DNA-binding NtrC family response regulator
MTTYDTPCPPVRLLLVATPGARAHQILLALAAAGLAVREQVVSHASALGAALREKPWDIVVCDFESSGLSGLVALRIVRAAGLDLPFVFVSGAEGTAAAVAAIKAGADDYIPDCELAQLAPAMRHEIARALERTQRRHAQQLSRTVLAGLQAH